MNRKIKKLFNKFKSNFTKKKKRTTWIFLNIISILMMTTGPILMILPGPQVISWVGLAIFIYINYDLLIKFKWFNKIIKMFKIWDIKRKIGNRRLLRF